MRSLGGFSVHDVACNALCATNLMGTAPAWLGKKMYTELCRQYRAGTLGREKSVEPVSRVDRAELAE